MPFISFSAERFISASRAWILDQTRVSLNPPSVSPLQLCSRKFFFGRSQQLLLRSIRPVVSLQLRPVSAGVLSTFSFDLFYVVVLKNFPASFFTGFSSASQGLRRSASACIAALLA